jgi:endonuclease/exonuclease/phosphatase family metal-dependent hydrolase
MKAKEFSISSFNLYNLNEPNMPIYTDKNGWTEEEYKQKINWISDQLIILKSDVVGFQELWHAASLKKIMEIVDPKKEYALLVPENANGKRIVCAAIVRKTMLLGNPEWINDFPNDYQLYSSGDDEQTPEINITIKGFSRPVLHFQIKPREDDSAIDIYVCHFKSKAPTKIYKEEWYNEKQEILQKHANCLGSTISTIRRTAESAALRFILTEQMKGNNNPVIVIGDINDDTHSNTANILTEQPKYLVGDSVGGGDIALYTAQTLQEYRDTRDVYYTHIHQDIRESLDHIMVSQELYDNSKKRKWIFNGLIINNDHLNFEDHKKNGTNDHGIIRASFKYKPKTAED